MSEDNKVTAEVRTQFGKGFARRLRAAGQIPAVLYGHGTEPVHLALPGHQVALLIRRANAVLELSADGKNHLALVKDLTPYRSAAHAVGSISLPDLARLNEAVTEQAAVIAVIGQFKILMMAMLIVSPLVLFLRKPLPLPNKGV